jgi:serine acetyltransferase
VIGHGSVVTAGSVVSQSVPPMTVVQGNPAVPVAKCGVPLRQDISMKTFSRNLQPQGSSAAKAESNQEAHVVDVPAVR